MTERGYRVKSDANKAGWEESDFPILCETCLGENPYLRMMKEPAGKACKICERPYTTFRWRPGPRARFKSTQVCQMCSKVKNVCQTCVLDLTYGLPVQVRDAFLAKAQQSLTTLAVPESNVGRAYQAQQHQAMLAHGGGEQDEQLHQGLLRLARKNPNYRRNLPHICSFYARGECNRGDECPYRHEIPRSKNDPLSKQNIVDRFHGRNDPVAERMMKRTAGKAQYADPPNEQVRTLWLAPVDAATTQTDIRDKFYAYGEIQSIKIIPDKCCAFVEYANQSQAIEACKALYASLVIKETPVRVSWAHAPKRGPRLLGDGAPSAAAAPSAGAGGAASGPAATATSGDGAAATSNGGTFQFPAYMMKAMPPPPGLRPGMKIPPPPKGMPAYAGVVPPPPPRKPGQKKSSGPVRPGRTPHAAIAAHPYYKSMDARAMGSRMNVT